MVFGYLKIIRPNIKAPERQTVFLLSEIRQICKHKKTGITHMRKRSYLYTAAFLVFCSVCYPQNIISPYEVGIWQGFRSAAVTYTFDDIWKNQLNIAVPMFNEFGFQLTLFTITDPGQDFLPANWNGLQIAAYQGHEIASHSVTHTSFAGMTDSMQLFELKNSQDTINAHIKGQKCVSIAYPYCRTGNSSLVERFYLAARVCRGGVENETPSNFMSINSIICGSQGRVKTSADFESMVNKADSINGWCVYLIHGINDNEPVAWSPISADTLRASLVYLKANNKKFWVSTFGNVARYIRERDCLSLTETSQKDSIITLQATDTLDNELYNFPVTIRRPLPKNWPSATATQNGKKIHTSFVEIGSKQYVMFDVIPDGGDITLIKTGTTDVN
jgi:peptidoglycan/xylan/chitin deacetylase (PgdA/CDA1 family)